MMPAPVHVAWLQNTGETIQTADGPTVEVWELHYTNDEAILSAWAKHFREHYCRDIDLPDLVSGTGLSKAQFLTRIKFPDASIAPGPSTRAGDFGEILVADFVEYVLGYWCPREGRYENRDNRNVPSNGCDILGFKFAGAQVGGLDDELFLLESKAGFTPTTTNRLQQAIDGSIKDLTREAMSLNAIKQRLLKTNREDALKVERFQNEGDRPFMLISGAVAVFEDSVFDSLPLDEAIASQHPNNQNLRLIVIKGTSMMDLVTALYARAADEARPRVTTDPGSHPGDGEAPRIPGCA
jgi:hypothetical protein